MKNIIKMMLGVTMILVLGACSNSDTMSKEDSKVAFETAMKATSDADNYEMIGTSFTRMTMGETKLEIKETYDSVWENINKENPRLQLHHSMTGFEEDQEFDMYYNDGKQYISSELGKAYMELQFESVSPLSDMFRQLDPTFYDDLVGLSKDGLISFTATYDDEKIMKLVEDLVGMSDITKASGSMEIIVDASTNLVKSKIMTVSAEIADAKMAYKLECNYSDYGVAKVELPSDLDTYVSE